MAKQEKESRQIIKRLKHKYRLVVVNDESLEERASLLLSPLNLVTWGSLLLFIFILIGASIIAFTPLKSYLPGFEDMGTRQQATANIMRLDSLLERQRIQQQYVSNLEMILSGQVGDSSATSAAVKPADLNKHDFAPGREDSLLRKEVETEDEFNLTLGENATANRRRILFFNPVKGRISSKFDLHKGHFGVDITAPENSTINATLDGKVVLVTWSADFGHVICLSHDQNYLSIYKHNSQVLKKLGDRVRAGDPIAIIGNSGEHTTGPHLHFELWQEGKPLDPAQHIMF